MATIIQLNSKDDESKELLDSIWLVLEYLEREKEILIGDGKGNVKKLTVSNVIT